MAVINAIIVMYNNDYRIDGFIIIVNTNYIHIYVITFKLQRSIYSNDEYSIIEVYAESIKMSIKKKKKYKSFTCNGSRNAQIKPLGPRVWTPRSRLHHPRARHIIILCGRE